jgi:AraC-like DNA-binding protein
MMEELTFRTRVDPSLVCQEIAIGVDASREVALLMEALRLHLAEHSHHRTVWLFALANRQMRRLIAAIHAEPGRKSTLEALAKVTGMSRSSFAVRFKDTVGEPAMASLTRCRMMVASDRLVNGGTPMRVWRRSSATSRKARSAPRSGA